MPQSEEKLSELQSLLEYSFKDVSLLEKALVHSSYCSKHTSPSATAAASVRADMSNERLEFLGDRVLGLVIAEYLYRHHAGTEGELAKKLNYLVNRSACAEAARKVDLGRYLILSPGEQSQGGAEKEVILADGCEALLAAVYLDGGLKAAEKTVFKLWNELLSAPLNISSDFKSALQEASQAVSLGLPVYEVIERSGPDHAPIFTVSAKIGDRIFPPAQGGSKKSAENAAAELALKEMRKNKA